VGKIEKKKKIDCELGNYKYLVRIDPETKIWIIPPYNEFEINDSVYILSENRYCRFTD